MKINQKINVSICVAILVIMSQLSIQLPFTAVPLTFQLVTVIIISIILGKNLGTIATSIYILLGAIGIPVFANFNGGISYLLKPTGGYLIGFLFLSFLVGYASKKNNPKYLYLYSFIGLLLDYLIGTIQLKLALNLSIYQSVLIGVIPFIAKDIILVIVSIPISLKIKKILKLNNLLIN